MRDTVVQYTGTFKSQDSALAVAFGLQMLDGYIGSRVKVPNGGDADYVVNVYFTDDGADPSVLGVGSWSRVIDPEFFAVV